MITLPNVILRDVYSSRPAAGSAGHLFFASDSGRQYRDNGATWDDVTPTPTAVIGITIDGGGSAITTGVKGYISVPFACTITGWDIVADQSGSISVEVDKHAGSVPNTTTDKISASSPVALSSAQVAQGGSISGWTTSVAAGDVIGFNVASATTITRATVTLRVTRS